MSKRRKTQAGDDYTSLPGFERKCVPMVGVKVVDADEGIVEAFVAGIGNVDDGGDIIEATFFQSSLDKHLKKLPKGVWSHDWNQPIARTLETETVPAGDARLPESLKSAGAGGQYVKMQFNLKTQRGADAFQDVVFFDGEQEWSIGYVPINSKRDAKTGIRRLPEGIWYEYSPVLFGMNPLTATVGVKALAQVAGMSYEDACQKLRSMLQDADETKREKVLDAIRDMAEAEEPKVAVSGNVIHSESNADIKIGDEPETKQALTGTLEERLSAIEDAIRSWVISEYPENDDGQRYVWAYSVGTFDESVIAVVWNEMAENADERRQHFEFPYTLDEDGSVTLGDPTPVDLEVVVTPKQLVALMHWKEGRRHSKADEDALQSIHDGAVALGALCGDEKVATPRPPEPVVVQTTEGAKAVVGHDVLAELDMISASIG